MTVRITRFRGGNGMTVSAYDFPGKKVLSRRGNEIGTVKDILLNTEKMDINSIIISQGMFKSDIEIGKTYIDHLTKESIILNITPAEELKNKEVYDKKGKYLGRVKDVKRTKPTNNFHKIIVDPGLGMPNVDVTTDRIKEFGDNIILETDEIIPA